MMRVKLDTTLEVSTEPGEGSLVMKLTELENWYSSPPVRVDIADLPLSDGGFAPTRTYRSAKSMAIQGVAYGGSPQEAVDNVWQIVAGLAPNGQSMTLTVEDDSSVVKSMRVWLNGGPLVLPFGRNKARFSIPIIAPDPRKYGPEVISTTRPSGTSDDGLTFPLFAGGFLDFGAFSPSGLIYVTNTGTAESWPVFKVQGSINSAGFDILSGGQTVRYAAAVPLGTEVILSPYAGGRASISGTDVTNNLTQSQWPSILPGETRLYVFDPLGVADSNALLTTLFSEAWW